MTIPEVLLSILKTLMPERTPDSIDQPLLKIASEHISVRSDAYVCFFLKRSNILKLQISVQFAKQISQTIISQSA